MRLKGASFLFLALLLAPQSAASAQAHPPDVAEGFRDGSLECFSSKTSDEQGCDRDAFEFPQEARAEGWFIVLRDRDNRSWYFRRGDVMLGQAPETQTPVRVLGPERESGVRQ